MDREAWGSQGEDSSLGLSRPAAPRTAGAPSSTPCRVTVAPRPGLPSLGSVHGQERSVLESELGGHEQTCGADGSKLEAHRGKEGSRAGESGYHQGCTSEQQQAEPTQASGQNSPWRYTEPSRGDRASAAAGPTRSLQGSGWSTSADQQGMLRASWR